MTIAVARGLRPYLFALIFFSVILTTYSTHHSQHWEALRERVRSARLYHYPPQVSLTSPSTDAAAAIFAVPDPADLNDNDKHSHEWYTEAKLRQLAACTAAGNCARNADKVVIIGAQHCHHAVFGKYGGGEGVWCRGMVNSLQRQGYTVLFARDDFDYMYHIYRQIPDMVKVIIAGTDGYRGKPQDVFKSKSLPDGIPAWKYFWFYYFPRNDGDAIAARWIVGAEPGTGNDGLTQRNDTFTYLGYSLENPIPPVPLHDRPMRAYILAKRVQYFYDKFGLPNYITREMITQAYDELRLDYPTFEFVGAFVDDRTDAVREKTGEISIPRGVRNMYPLNSTQFDIEVANSRVLVGLGNPGLSPSPYRALAQGVPFINPHRIGDPTRADDPMAWRHAQHDSLRLETAPRVYQVAEGNYTEFVTALRSALETPCPATIYERMRPDVVDARMARFVEHDWRAEAEALLERRAAGEPVPDSIRIKEFVL